MSGGYDVDLFVESLDSELICSICRCVFRCPVRVACNHVFCKSCILQWIRRQESCPCCRQPVSPALMVVVYKLSKAIGRLKVKCGNEGCSAVFPLSEDFLHASSCLFQEVPCPHQGCTSRVPRHHLESHARHCPYWSQLCGLGCGALLTQQTRTQHNCYRQLREQVDAQTQRHRAIAGALRRKTGRLQRAVTQMRRQVALICESLEALDEGGGGEGGEGGGGGGGGAGGGAGGGGEEDRTEESSTSSSSSHGSP